MSGVTHLLDTSVYSQPLRRPGSRNVHSMARWKSLGDARLAVCVISDAEIRTGLILKGSARMSEQYETVVRGSLRTLAVDAEVAETFAGLKARQMMKGSPVADMDLLVAACARTHGLVVATLNHRDFSRIEGLAWEDWGEVGLAPKLEG